MRLRKEVRIQCGSYHVVVNWEKIVVVVVVVVVDVVEVVVLTPLLPLCFEGVSVRTMNGWMGM